MSAFGLILATLLFGCTCTFSGVVPNGSAFDFGIDLCRKGSTTSVYGLDGAEILTKIGKWKYRKTASYENIGKGPNESASDITRESTAPPGQKMPSKRLQSLLQTPSAKVNAPRPLTKQVLARHKFKPPVTKIQGVPPSSAASGKIAMSSNLHVTGGALKGRKLCTPLVYLRPMMAKVKLALFTSLQDMGLFAYGRSCNVLDLFCGSGSVGIEAISFGAHKCTFVDLSLDCCKATAMNLEHCGIRDLGRVIRADALELISKPWLYAVRERFDLMLLTPPYEEVVYSELMEAVSNCSLLKENGLVVVEYPKEIKYLGHRIGNLVGMRNRKYGRTTIATFCFKPDAKKMEACNKYMAEFAPRNASRAVAKSIGFLQQPSALVI